MADWLLQWGFFVFPPLVASVAALWVWGRTGRFGFALGGGTLGGMIAMLVISSMFWSGNDICDVCHDRVAQVAGKGPQWP
ncbi:hypothetical protein ATO6_17545 [Oceanicola sp. 22II-s10i]|uniref:hypothetical protein n=1 Tax=Oceanicola sp. 22II-s10i TaxID=1317116 RepID=UPI000B529280|nr:hypothetical protein [Oceanicola sp. 22II-s10i]OWU83665.1 hypothetical protein ATO6_17545 [Oceanicola sp. 22II-s10i]